MGEHRALEYQRIDGLCGMARCDVRYALHRYHCFVWRQVALRSGVGEALSFVDN